MDKKLIIDVCSGETRVGLLENAKLAEVSIERSNHMGNVGTIYKGRVKKVLPGMQSAFVDIGLEKDAFLYVSDVDPRFEDFDALATDFFLTPGETDGSSGRKRRKKVDRKIEDLLTVDQEIIVQIIREPLGTKGARVTTHVSLPGRFLVLMPTVKHIGVSRKISSFAERKRLKETITNLKTNSMGIIVRTAAKGKNQKDLKNDFKDLQKKWRSIKKISDSKKAPAVLSRDEDLIIRLVRDILDNKFKSIWINSSREARRLKTFLNDYHPALKRIVKVHEGDVPIFEHFGIEEKLQKLFRNKVWLNSGGHLVINQTEALVAIDINTGKYVGARDLEDTILKLNLEAIEEIVHQIRLRDLGGIIIIDFIDMEIKSNRKKVINAFYREMRKDRAQYKILPINEFGLLQLTRKRVKSSLIKTLSRQCPYCDGMGYVKSAQTVCYEIKREIIKLKPHLGGKELVIRAYPEIVETLRVSEYEIIENLEKKMKKKINLKEDRAMHWESFDIMSI